MSDARTPEPARTEPAVAPSTPVENRVADVDSTHAIAEPAATPVAESPASAPAVVEKKKRGVGAWSFVLGLLTSLVDIGLLVLGVVALVGVASAAMSGDIEALQTVVAGAGLVFLVLLVFFGGFITGGIAVLLGLIALISGRGRVLGVFGFLFGAAAIAARLLILSSGFSPDLG